MTLSYLRMKCNKTIPNTHHTFNSSQDMAEHYEATAIPESKEATVATIKKSSRRPDIDVIRIVLTWGILVYHTALIYGPYFGYYVKIIPDTVDYWQIIYIWFAVSMNVWNMPMFFFLSGVRKGNIWA